MARGKRSRRRSSGGGQRAFCPTIRIKCSTRKYGRAVTAHGPQATPTQLTQARYAEAKRKLRKAMGLGNVHPQAEATSLPAAAVKTVARAKANLVGKCTISSGGKTYRASGAAVGTKVAQLIRQQKAGGCCHPKVTRG